MSRAQQSNVISTAKNQNATNFGNAQTAEGDTQNDIQNYQSQLAKFVSGNPYTKGGEYDQTINPALANVSDAGSNSLKGALQAQSLRTGQNSAADAATAASGAQANTRQLSSDLATAQQQRISGETGYNTTALGATATPISAESSLYGTAGGQAGQALSTQAGSSATPSFWDEVGNSVANIPAAAASGAAGAYTKCWVAAALYGGWHDERVKLLRRYIFDGPPQQTWYGRALSGIYEHWGYWAAKVIRRSRLARKLAHLVFDRLLLRAREWK